MSPPVLITMPGGLTMNSLPCTMSASIRKDARGDHHAGEVEGDPADLRAKLDTRRHQPTPLLHVLAGMLPDHESFSGCGCVSAGRR
jgi:hypothetical protein